jgi:hypothetical protein
MRISSMKNHMNKTSYNSITRYSKTYILACTLIMGILVKEKINKKYSVTRNQEKPTLYQKTNMHDTNKIKHTQIPLRSLVYAKRGHIIPIIISIG